MTVQEAYDILGATLCEPDGDALDARKVLFGDLGAENSKLRALLFDLIAYGTVVEERPTGDVIVGMWDFEPYLTAFAAFGITENMGLEEMRRRVESEAVR